MRREKKNEVKDASGFNSCTVVGTESRVRPLPRIEEEARLATLEPITKRLGCLAVWGSRFRNDLVNLPLKNFSTARI